MERHVSSRKRLEEFQGKRHSIGEKLETGIFGNEITGQWRHGNGFQE